MNANLDKEGHAKLLEKAEQRIITSEQFKAHAEAFISSYIPKIGDQEIVPTFLIIYREKGMEEFCIDVHTVLSEKFNDYDYRVQVCKTLGRDIADQGKLLCAVLFVSEAWLSKVPEEELKTLISRRMILTGSNALS